MNWRLLAAVGCVIAFAAVPPSAWGETGGEQPSATPGVTPSPGAAAAAPASAPAPEAMSDTEKMIQDIKNPTSWFRWGADLRLREEYIKNARGLENDNDDTTNDFRIRPRLWFEFGPFFQDNSLNVPNGLSLFVRFTDETQIFLTRPTTGPFASLPWLANPVSYDEIIFDNLYAEWKRPGGIPVDFKVGRQDLTYGRGWVISNGTPLDFERSSYSDAAKMTVHFDDVKTDVDLFVADNKADERDRLAPIAFSTPAQYAQYLSEYDTKLVGAYLKTMYLKPTEFNLYYIYKDDTLADPYFYGYDPTGSILNTVGGLVQGPYLDDPTKKTWDYYLEGAYQWGREGAIPGVVGERHDSAWGVTSDLGYTFEQTAWTPRVHAEYENLSGDEPTRSTWGGWDPVLARDDQFSELEFYRWEFEGATGVGAVGEWSNLQRFCVGASANPIPRMTTSLDYNYILGNYHSFSNASVVPGTVLYGGGDTRGQLIVAKLLYEFNQHVSGHLWLEYFIPGGYYASGADNAVFLRWELMFKF